MEVFLDPTFGLSVPAGTNVSGNMLSNPNVVASVPEPATWLMLCVDVGLVGFVAGRSRPRNGRVLAARVRELHTRQCMLKVRLFRALARGNTYSMANVTWVVATGAVFVMTSGVVVFLKTALFAAVGVR